MKKAFTLYSPDKGSLRKVCLIFSFVFILSTTLLASSKNMLPRTPELVIEKGHSDSFNVVKCVEKVSVAGTTASSNLKAIIKNIGKKNIESSLKFRILYPTSENTIGIKINGKRIHYDRKDPRYTFKLKAGAEMTVEMSAKTSINFSVDALKKTLRKNNIIESKDDSKRKRFVLGDFSRLFSRENFGKRFMISPLISKWGIFPIDFDKVRIEISVPRDFVLVANNSSDWVKSSKANSFVFRYNKNDNFSGAVFLPGADLENFKKWQKILSSKELMR